MATSPPALLPLPSARLAHAFTSSPGVHQNDPSIKLANLSDKALGVHKVTSGLTHNIVAPPLPPPSSPAGSASAWEAVYPAGSYKPSGPIKGGFGFYVSGAQHFRAALEQGVEEVVMGYEMLFEEGFDFVKGGKLPGAFGGSGDLAYRCTGGRKEDRCKCFDFRLMFRKDGAGELYAYAPLTENNERALLAVPGSRANNDYGMSVGRGLFAFTAGVWTTVAIRVKLNTVGAENGQVELFIDGRSLFCVNGLTLREDPASRIKGMHFQTFFGGSTPDWASPREQRAWFAGVSGAVASPGRNHDEL
ncbi:polysaccharide lyase family 14 protein [Peniophora sp. CONT]|nr:polysaccharide lyase family 14 protein [Peniophora sp. CONT]